MGLASSGFPECKRLIPSQYLSSSCSGSYSRAFRYAFRHSSNSPSMKVSWPRRAHSYALFRRNNRFSSEIGRGLSSTRRLTITPDQQFAAASPDTTSSDADCIPLRSPPASWPASSAEASLSGKSMLEFFWKASLISFKTMSFLSTFPWQQNRSPSKCPAEGVQFLPV